MWPPSIDLIETTPRVLVPMGHRTVRPSRPFFHIPSHHPMFRRSPAPTNPRLVVASNIRFTVLAAESLKSLPEPRLDLPKGRDGDRGGCGTPRGHFPPGIRDHRQPQPQSFFLVSFAASFIEAASMAAPPILPFRPRRRRSRNREGGRRQRSHPTKSEQIQQHFERDIGGTYPE